MGKLTLYIIGAMVLLASFVYGYYEEQDFANELNWSNLDTNYAWCFDGNYGTACQVAGFDGEEGKIWQNYTLNVSVSDVHNISWWVHTKTGSNRYNYTFSLENGCIQSKVQTRINMTEYNSGTKENATFYCHNGTDWSLQWVKEDMGNLADDLLIVSANSSLDNCSTFKTQLLNWTFYRAPDFLTTADDKINISCSDNGGTIPNYVDYTFDQQSNIMCTNSPVPDITCTGYIKYTGDWTNRYIYEESINAEDYGTAITYKNLTVPKLFLGFSTATDITVIDSNNTYYFDGVNTLIAMSNLSIGKVSVIFNDATQYYEFDNDQTTYHDINLTVLSEQDSYISIRAQDRTFSVMSDAIINIYKIDGNANTTTLISRLYGNNEKSIKLFSNDTYLARAYYPNYEQNNYFDYFRPEELTNNELVITMKETSLTDWIDFTQNYPSKLPNDVDVDITIGVEGQTTIGTIQYRWTWDSNPVTTTTVTTTSKESYESTQPFLTNSDNLSVTVVADGISKTFYFQHYSRDKLYEDSFYGTLLTSKFAFVIFFIVALALSLSIHKKFDNYGQEAMMIITSIFCFINLWMLLIAVPLIIGKIGKVNIGSEI